VVVGSLVSACASPSRAPFSTGLVQPSPPSTSAVTPGVTPVPGLLPFPIERHIGQTDPRVGYLLRAGAMKVGLGAGELTYMLSGAGDPAGAGRAGWRQNRPAPSVSDGPTPSWTVRQELVGASKTMPIGTVGSPATISYFKASAEQWLAGVPAFEQVAYAEAWPGITVTYERGPVDRNRPTTWRPGQTHGRFISCTAVRGYGSTRPGRW
jgi:hypothetical protein